MLNLNLHQMKKLIFITLLFNFGFIQAQDTLIVSKNSVKIHGYKSVHYIISNTSKQYIGQHLPLLFKVSNETEWIEVCYNDGKKVHYSLQRNYKQKTDEEKSKPQLDQELIAEKSKNKDKCSTRIRHAVTMEEGVKQPHQNL
jgi:hypothetical protein